MSVAVPEQGQIVEVRRRRYVVADVTKSTLAQSALATELTSIQHRFFGNSRDNGQLEAIPTLVAG